MLTRRERQIWNDAVEACKAAALAEVTALEAKKADGMPSPARSVVRAISEQVLPDDERMAIRLAKEEDLRKLFVQHDSMPDFLKLSKVTMPEIEEISTIVPENPVQNVVEHSEGWVMRILKKVFPEKL